MPTRRRTYSTKHARRTSRRVNESTIGTHVQRRAQTGSQQSRRMYARPNKYAQSVLRRARIKRIATIAVIAIIVLAIAVGVGVFAFRSVVGGELSLKNSDAKDALVAVKSTEPSYTLITAELGATAEPLETAGPDVLFLARLDPGSKKLALVSIPSGLQVTSDNKSESIATIAQSGDAALIKALSTFLKVDISHIVKLNSEQDVANLVDALGGVTVNVSEPIDDPHAGSICIPAGEQRLDGKTALVFLRATNIEYGAQDRLANQLIFAAQVVADVFSGSGAFAAKMDSIDTYIQTDYSFGDLQAIESMIGGVSASDISTVILPGYYAVMTNVSGTDGDRYVSTSQDVTKLKEDLDNNSDLDVSSARTGDTADPSSFKVDIQNGTSIEGAAASVADMLKKEGFKVGDVGNAEAPIYKETLVVYRGDDPQGPARARAVINALGSGRPVDGDAYYTFNADVLLMIGSDNKPIS